MFVFIIFSKPSLYHHYIIDYIICKPRKRNTDFLNTNETLSFLIPTMRTKIIIKQRKLNVIYLVLKSIKLLLLMCFLDAVHHCNYTTKPLSEGKQHMTCAQKRVINTTNNNMMMMLMTITIIYIKITIQ